MIRYLSNTVGISLGCIAEKSVVFNGYSNIPSKDCAHMWRSGGTIGVTVHFNSSIALQTKKGEFLSNKHSKQRFTALLS